MCYLVREHAAESERGTASPVRTPERVRSRWAGAAAATVIGGLALAALVAPSPTAPLAPPPQQQFAAAGMASRTATIPAGAVIEQTALPAGDDVPTAPDATRAGIGPCHHGL